jgi:hypothetical protein
MRSAFARIVDDLVFDYDPLTETGTKFSVVDEHGHRTLRGGKLADPRLRMPTWEEPPLNISYGLQKRA